uniref:Uncharacterized protein n=1 Tax=Rhizophora mucronata TaxID=61149 RepID=A0A2P2NYU2_RHIMU
MPNPRHSSKHTRYQSSYTERNCSLNLM